MPVYRNDQPSWTEKGVGALCYLTGGLAGIIYIIITRSSGMAPFFRFHFLQSIVLGILAIFLQWSVGAMNTIAPAVYNLPGVAITLTIGLFAFGLIPIYGLIFCLLGKYAEIPWLSDVVRNQMR